MDLGVRTYYAVGLPDLSGEKMVAHYLDDPFGKDRWEELVIVRDAIEHMIQEGDHVFVEEPPLAGSKNVRVFGALNQMLGAILASSPCKAYPIAVGEWKKTIVGNGSADKDAVADWLSNANPQIFDLCDANQNLVDAACIALYGQHLTRIGNRAG